MEMNTRLQVEHPATEMITGLDLVEWQIRVAAGQALPLAQEQISCIGHAIEARIYAEDPERDFLPQAGRIERLDFPDPGPHVRVDAGVRGYGEVKVYYDPMIAKLIVLDEDRPAALRRLGGALGDVHIIGLSTNVEFLRRIAAHEAYRDAALDTGFIARRSADLLAPPLPASNEILAIAAIGFFCAQAAIEAAQARSSNDPWSPWSRQDGWRLNEWAQKRLALREIGTPAQADLAIDVTYLRDGWKLDLPGGERIAHALGALAEDGALSVDLDGRRRCAVWVHSAETIYVFCRGQPAHRFALADPVADAAKRSETRTGLVSPMPGRIIALLVEPGARVEADQPVLILEAMKMEHQLRAATRGIVKAFKFRVGDQAPEGVELLSFEAEEP
jgi:3-methylcrotonyl-CoA carboxylase alpha subunit